MRFGAGQTIRYALLLGVALGVFGSPGVVAAAQGTQRAEAENPTREATFTEQELRDVPGARDVWALLEHWTPVVVSQRLDSGGSATGSQGLVSARSTTWRENGYRLEGVDVTDPAVRGTSGFYYDYDALEELRASWGTQPTSVATAGVLLDMRLQSGADSWHGAAQGYFEAGAMQANNLSDDLAGQGVPRTSDIDYLSDVSVQAGGRLARDRAWIFGSFRDWRISQAVPGFDEPVATKLPVFTAKLTAAPSSRNGVSVFYSRQSYTNPARGAGAFVSPEATLVEESTVGVLGGTWRREFGGGAVDALTLRGSFLDIDFPLLLQGGITGQSQFDIVTQVRSRSASVASTSRRRRYALDAEVGLSADTSSTTHRMLTGLQYQYAPTETEWTAVGDVNVVTSSGVPFLAQILGTPVDTLQNARAFGVFFHDDIQIGGRWSASVGLRYDDWKGSLPAQSSPAGTYAPARQFDRDPDLIDWRDLAPRATVSFDAFGDGKLVVLAGFSQYVHQLSTSTLGFANPNSLSVETVAWDDINGDGQFQPGEGSAPMNVAGGAIGTVDPALRAPLTREFRAGLAYDLGGGWNAQVDLWYRKDTRLFDDVEVGLGIDDYEDTVVVDPGRDNVLGSADDSALPAFNQISGFGDNQLLLTTVDEKTVKYRGMDIGVQRGFADGWQLRATLTLGLAQGLTGKTGFVPGDAGGISDLFNDPNAVINADARFFWDRPYVLKIYGSYLLPHDFVLAGTLRSWAGAPLARILPVPLNQGIVNLFAEPRGALRESTLTTADLRISKRFDLTPRVDVALYGDFFNVTNAGTITRTNDTFPFFGTPAAIVAPFVARIGVRFGF